MKSEKGFSLIEMLIVVALIAIITAIAVMGYQSYQGHNLTAASKQLYSDLQKTRVDAMTRNNISGNAPNSRGFGIRVNSNTTYTIFEFNDPDNNFIDDGGAEEVAVRQTTLPTGVTVAVNGAAGDPNVLIFDKKGLAKATTWAGGGRTYIISLSGVAQVRCVTLDDIRIREGIWDGSTCQKQ